MDKKMIIDYREECLLKYWPGVETGNLPVGDIIENGWCFERKSPKDFLSSILDRRVFNQAINLWDNYPNKCVIIVEADLKSLADTIWFGQIPNITIEGVRGAIASLYTKYHVPVLLVSNRHGFVEMVNKLIEKSKETDEILLFEPPVSKCRANPKLQVLLQIPKIGQKKAKRILEHYGEFSNIGKMEKPSGVSQKDLDLIREILK